jgi:hypothetical protein
VSDIFNEVDEDVRRDKSLELWKAYGKYVIGLLVLIVVATAAVVGWQEYSLSRSQAQGAQFEKAVALSKSGNHDGAASAFAELANDADSGYQALALLQQAGALVKAGKFIEAIAVYDALAADASVNNEFSTLATILAGYQLLDHGSPDDVRSRVEKLSVAGQVWTAAAQELMALSYLKDANYDKAKEFLTQLNDGVDVPAGIKSRAKQLLATLN